MKITDLQTNGGGENPCELVARYMLHEQDGGTLVTFIQEFDFDERVEIERAIRDFLRVVYADKYMRNKKLAEQDPIAAAVFSRCKRIIEDQSKYDKYPNVTSGEIWHGGFSRKRLQQRTARMFEVKPDAAKFARVCERIKRVYGLSETDIEKLRFFVEQTKAGDLFPDSLRRMLYIWGKDKKTGKTTSAKMLTCVLNGDNDYHNVARYSSKLQDEMQVGSFKVPKISECNAVLMDECFYADMGKTYADFKRFITASNGRARLPFGQEFEWYGHPNYIATSNEPLSVFIKDWGDRRYLSIHFEQQPAERMTEDEVLAMWRDFAQNSTKRKDWQDWAADIMEVASEDGERTIVTREFENDLRKSRVLKRILDQPHPASRFCADNKITVKFFVDMFAEEMGSAEAHKRRKEIEEAVTAVFGKKYSTTNYWMLTELQRVANEMLNTMWQHETDESDTDNLLNEEEILL